VASSCDECVESRTGPTCLWPPSSEASPVCSVSVRDALHLPFANKANFLPQYLKTMLYVARAVLCENIQPVHSTRRVTAVLLDQRSLFVWQYTQQM
jgi:hypothetical protein